MLRQKLDALRPKMAKAAQAVYDDWNQNADGEDEELGGGGICDQVSEAISGIIASSIRGVELFDGGQDGDDHAWTVAQLGSEAFGVDIPPSAYESGGGYSWKKKPGVTFGPQSIAIFKVPAQ